ncbi:RNA recognition motif domain-containing protein [Nitrospira sp. Nam74]
MPYRIFIDPLPRDFTSTDLAALLQPFGEVLSAEIAYDSLGFSLRFGHAEMRSEEAANNVVKQLDGEVFHDAPLTVVRTEDRGRAFWDQPGMHRLAS